MTDIILQTFANNRDKLSFVIIILYEFSKLVFDFFDFFDWCVANSNWTTADLFIPSRRQEGGSERDKGNQ